MKKLFLVVITLFSTINFLVAQQRVKFMVSNPSLKSVTLDFRSFDSESRKTAGYGYSLNSLGSHAVNLPAPAFVYIQKDGKFELLAVVKKADEGKSFSVNKKYEISREDYLTAANREEYLKNAYDELEKETDKIEKIKQDNSIEGIAKSQNLKMVKIIIKGSSVLPSQVHVRVQLPWDKNPKSQTGFSESLSIFKERTVKYPVGTKVYVCDAPYWKTSKYNEKLLVTIDEEKQNYSYKL
jgi:hypothetical protein